MSDRERALDRAHKLMRLAAPSSGATDAERANAALAAAAIFAEHGFVPAEAPPKVKRQRPPTAPPPAQYPSYSPFAPSPYYPQQPVPRQYYPISSANWTHVEMTRPSKCGVCGMPLHKGEDVYFDEVLGYRCFEFETCGIEY